MISPEQAQVAIVSASAVACDRINQFSAQVLQTRGGRIGSGMGSLLEALWGYNVNCVLRERGGELAQVEIGWFPDHDYNDFACIRRNAEWDPTTRRGELLRIEAKSMNMGADESKGHFDEIIECLCPSDLLLVLVWSWDAIDECRVSPRIRDHYIGPARVIATLRDRLHVARGGRFVDRADCPDGCAPEQCKHHGEPLNADGKRERKSGPSSCRGENVSYAANFGGLVRMLKTSSSEARHVFRKLRKSEPEIHRYISFLHRNFPDEEANQYSATEWKLVARALGVLPSRPVSKEELIHI